MEYQMKRLIILLQCDYKKCDVGALPPLYFEFDYSLLFLTNESNDENSSFHRFDMTKTKNC